MEQLEASTHQQLDQYLPMFNLPSKILCSVVNVELRAEVDSDEVYAQIMLQPEADQSELTSPDPELKEPEKCTAHSFCKTLAASDTSTHGGRLRIHLVKNWLPKISMALNGIFGTFFESQLLIKYSALVVDKFNVCRTSRSDFVVSVNKYLEAKKQKISVGMRFKMRFEGDEAPERRFSGTIIDIGSLPAMSKSLWADSDWRSLKVQWDEPSSILRPDRISPWEDYGNPQLTRPGLSFSEPQRARQLFPSIPTSTFSSSSNVNFNSKNEPSMLSSQFYWSARYTRADSCAASTNTIIVEKKQEQNSGGCRLFGIDICSAEEEVLPVVTASALGYDQTAASIELNSDKLSQPSDVNNSDAPGASSERSPPESQSRQVRSCTKVIMQGMAVGRAVDLTKLSGYSDLCHKLEEMFDILGELGSTLKKWRVIYTDDEDDMMLVGDDPWNEFCDMVKRIYIYTYEEAKKLTVKVTG
ncbi:hypothetical protein C2845_PM16G08430 [Panicum miliaceum]|uniref:Auxin-responsive protein n=1 Tax=Panicum miliaceum TaxID=4540 RepID=A0A3L6PVP2_PANMI|nr:hypothetical protein C2845_PM16G08430 [Panicum miliaceum]